MSSIARQRPNMGYQGTPSDMRKVTSYLGQAWYPGVDLNLDKGTDIGWTFFKCEMSISRAVYLGGVYTQATMFVSQEPFLRSPTRGG